MKKRIFRVVVVAALFTVPALADAPSDQYRTFTEADTTIFDTKTQLTWQRTATGPATHQIADLNCQGLKMRLPTIKELLTLVDEQPHKQYEKTEQVDVYADQSAFGGIDVTGSEITPVDAPYWTQTPAASQFWTLDFKTGTTAKALGSTPLYVRCVSP